MLFLKSSMAYGLVTGNQAMVVIPLVPKEDMTALHNKLQKVEKKLHSPDVQAGAFVRSAGPVCFHNVTHFSNPIQL